MARKLAVVGSFDEFVIFELFIFRSVCCGDFVVCNSIRIIFLHTSYLLNKVISVYLIFFVQEGAYSVPYRIRNRNYYKIFIKIYIISFALACKIKMKLNRKDLK